jgi:hypothetical protein
MSKEQHIHVVSDACTNSIFLLQTAFCFNNMLLLDTLKVFSLILMTLHCHREDDFSSKIFLCCDTCPSSIFLLQTAFFFKYHAALLDTQAGRGNDLYDIALLQRR